MDYKNIVLCSDGTGNSNVKGRGTNVFKLFEAVDVNGHRSDPSLRRQLAFYNDGVGTQSLRWVRAFAGATGYGLSRNVKNLYRELCRVYEPGDQIYLFGFSRGAFTVRTLAGLITDCGLIDPTDYQTEQAFRAQIRAAYKSYRRKYQSALARLFRRPGMPADEFKRRYARRNHSGAPLEPCIKLLGVWDTVDAVGLPFRLADFWNSVIWQFKFKTTSLSPIVERGCHALAMDDERGAFMPVLWDETAAAVSARVEQVWFAGAHSNVGGGYPQQGMSLVTLDWMMAKAEQQELRFAPSAHDRYRSEQAFADRLYNPRAGLGIFYRSTPRNITRLCADKGIAAPRIHVSAIERIVQAPDGYAPGNMPPYCSVAATEEDPLVNLRQLAETIAGAHGGRQATPLLEHQVAWLRAGLVAYLAFIGGTLAAVIRALWTTVGSASDTSEIVSRTRPLVDTFPLSLIAAILRDPLATSLLMAGLGVGYLLSNISDRHTSRAYSTFWHQHRPALREAIRRTPAPSPSTTAAPFV